MLTLAYPWMLALLPLPFLVRWLTPPHVERREGLVTPFLDRLAELTGQAPAEGAVEMRGGRLRQISLIVSWLAVIAALARPQWIEPPLMKTIPVRDMLLAVDLSGSMETKDFVNSQGQTVDRLTAIKEVLDDFLSRRKGDRVGLIFFGSAAFVQAPFTDDLNVCRQLLAEAQPRLAGPQTAFGDALGLAITTFERSDARERVLIALTDGNDTSSKIPPQKAAEIAHDHGIVIHTVAVGDPRAAGEDALDVETLKKIAEITGGVYSFAADHKQLDEIYRRLDLLETRQAQTVSYRPRRDVYFWPLAVGFVFALFQHTLNLLHHFRNEARRRRSSRRNLGSPASVPDASAEAISR